MTTNQEEKMRNWEKEFDNLFLEENNGEITTITGISPVWCGGTEMKEFIRQLLTQATQEAYQKGYEDGSDEQMKMRIRDLKETK